MKKLVTNELSLGLDQNLRNNLIDNFKKIQDGVDDQADALNKQIKDMLGDVPLQDQNEVTQARIDANGKQFKTIKGRLDSDQSSAETALQEERKTGLEVREARKNNQNITYQSLKKRLDNQENDLNNSINNKLAQISVVPEAFANLAALQSKYPTGKTGIFVTVDTGHKYIWSNNSWLDAGIYQSVGIAENSINPSKLSKIYDLQGDGNIYSGQYIVGYDNNNKIVLQKSDTTPFNVLEVYFNKAGIVHLKKSVSHVFGQAVLITDLQDKLVFSTYYEYGIAAYENKAIDYFVYVTKDEILINLDRLSDALGNDYKVWLAYPQDVTTIPLTMDKHNGFRSYLN